MIAFGLVISPLAKAWVAGFAVGLALGLLLWALDVARERRWSP